MPSTPEVNNRSKPVALDILKVHAESETLGFIVLGPFSMLRECATQEPDKV
jgi:hypothetical protein